MNNRFSSETELIIWKVLPILEAFANQWWEKANHPRYSDIKDAIEASLKTVYKYYNKTDASPVCIISLCTLSHHLTTTTISTNPHRSQTKNKGHNVFCIVVTGRPGTC